VRDRGDLDLLVVSAEDLNRRIRGFGCLGGEIWTPRRITVGQAR